MRENVLYKIGCINKGDMILDPTPACGPTLSFESPHQNETCNLRKMYEVHTVSLKPELCSR